MPVERYPNDYPSAADPTSARGALSPAEETELAQRFGERLRLFAVRRLGDATAGEDVAQETLRRVVESLRGGRVANLAALPGFVFETARHICQQRLRSLARGDRALRTLRGRLPSAAATAQPDPLSALVSAERRGVVRAALERLDESDRLLLRMFFYLDMKTAEVSERLAVSPPALRVRKHRALRRLAALLAEDEL